MGCDWAGPGVVLGYVAASASMVGWYVALGRQRQLGWVTETCGNVFPTHGLAAKVVYSGTLMGLCAPKMLGSSAGLNWCAEI